MLGEGRSTRTAGKAVGVSGEAVRKWIKREEAAGRPVDIVPAKQGRAPRPKPKKAAPAPATRIQGHPGVTPASVAAPVPPPDAEQLTFTLEEVKKVEPWGPEQAQKYLTLEAMKSPKPSDRINAATRLLDSRRKDGGGAGEHDAEWEALRRDPVAMEMLREMATRRREAEKQAG